LILGETTPNFDPLDPYQSVSRQRTTEHVSEWRIPVVAMKSFLATIA
jgi:hypothetical protein